MKKSKRLAFAGLFTALVFLFTAYISHIPAGNGFIHIGDALIYLAAALLPLPYACAAGALGAALADVATAPVWTLPTLLIKALLPLCFTCKREKILCGRNAFAVVPAALITLSGYYAAEGFLLGNWLAPLANLPRSLIQAAASAAVFLFAGAALDKAKIKGKF